MTFCSIVWQWNFVWDFMWEKLTSATHFFSILVICKYFSLILTCFDLIWNYFCLFLLLHIKFYGLWLLNWLNLIPIMIFSINYTVLGLWSKALTCKQWHCKQLFVVFITAFPPFIIVKKCKAWFHIACADIFLFIWCNCQIWNAKIKEIFFYCLAKLFCSFL